MHPARSETGTAPRVYYVYMCASQIGRGWAGVGVGACAHPVAVARLRASLVLRRVLRTTARASALATDAMPSASPASLSLPTLPASDAAAAGTGYRSLRVSRQRGAFVYQSSPRANHCVYIYGQQHRQRAISQEASKRASQHDIMKAHQDQRPCPLKIACESSHDAQEYCLNAESKHSMGVRACTHRRLSHSVRRVTHPRIKRKTTSSVSSISCKALTSPA